eukprot:CAMPEP_0114476174 /NCGR_PEP_ID=MMETSP0104-20121206/14589_1 /TAXON_ID=37642 ORGANISM="Paraphysomonas imperforata, Strain PA2" /NCGR_SAMPLE_ID=MMETSP0104 /ASSEMBLY_ACC=CAM_ASM_000202 /LENGTH=33 /DNA_ID= /DNA_START= /DNA_END= /DNA_ORIENTATION=
MTFALCISWGCAMSPLMPLEDVNGGQYVAYSFQ